MVIRFRRSAMSLMPLAQTDTCPIAAIRHRELPVYGMQFHPEVTHTPLGGKLLQNFVIGVCGCEATWHLGDFAEAAIQRVREQVGDRRVICGLSGGVDSSRRGGVALQSDRTAAVVHPGRQRFASQRRTELGDPRVHRSLQDRLARRQCRRHDS